MNVDEGVMCRKGFDGYPWPWASAVFFNMGGTLFCGGCGGPPTHFLENSRFNFPHSGEFYTQNNLPLSLFFHDDGMVTIMFWFNSQRTDTDNFFGSLFSLNESKI